MRQDKAARGMSFLFEERSRQDERGEGRDRRAHGRGRGGVAASRQGVVWSDVGVPCHRGRACLNDVSR